MTLIRNPKRLILGLMGHPARRYFFPMMKVISSRVTLSVEKINVSDMG